MDTFPLPLLAVASRAPLGLNATAVGAVPVATGVPRRVSPPSAATENSDTVLLPRLAVASKVPLGLNATAVGSVPVPVDTGVLIGTRPDEVTENMDTVFAPALAAATSWPLGLNATELLLGPPRNGGGGYGVSVPFGATLNNVTPIWLASAVAR
jgi:hypothetical protein